MEFIDESHTALEDGGYRNLMQLNILEGQKQWHIPHATVTDTMVVGDPIK